jgi:hypothetical protein
MEFVQKLKFLNNSIENTSRKITRRFPGMRPVSGNAAIDLLAAFH